MATDIERLTVTLEANVRKFEREMKRSNQLASQALGGIERRAKSMESSVRGSFDRVSGYAATALGALGVSASVGQFREYADTWQDMANKIAASGEQTERVAAVQDKVAKTAIASRSDLKSTSDLYVGLTRSTKDLGASQAQIFRVVETVNKAFAVSGASAAEQASGILQLNQALQSGALQGDELRSILENAPMVAEAVAKEFGVSVGELKKLGAEGELVADRVFQGLLKASASVDEQFKRTSITTSQAFTNLRTALTQYFGQMDQATGISRAFAGAIQTVALNIDVAMRAAAVLGAALLAAFSPAIIAGVGAIVAPLAGVAGLAAGVAAVAAGFAAFGDQIQPIAGELATLADYAQASFQILTEYGGQAADWIASQFTKAAELVTSALQAVDGSDAFDGVLEAAKTVTNAIIGAWSFCAAQVTTVWGAIGPVIVETMVNAMNGAIAAVESGLRSIIGAINGAFGGLGVPALPMPEFSRVTNAAAGAGAAAGKAWSDNFKLLSKDYVGDAMKSADKALQAIRDRANAAARERAASPPKQLDMGSLDQKLKPARRDADGGGGKGKGGGKGGGKGAGQDEFAREIEQIDKRILAFGREQEALKLSAFEAAKAEASFKMLDAAKAAGIPVTDGLRGKVEALATAYATAKTSLDRAKETQESFNEFQKFVGTSISSFFSDVISGGKNAEKALMNLTKKLADAVLQAALLGDGPLAGLMGLKGSGSGVGGLIGMLFKGVSIPGKASGGPVSAGRPYVVGEKRPELFIPSTGGRIVPRIGGGGASVVVNNYNGAPVETRQTANGGVEIDVGRMVDGALAERVASGRGLTSRAITARATRANLRG